MIIIKTKIPFNKKRFLIITAITAGLVISGIICIVLVNRKPNANIILEQPEKIAVENNIITWTHIKDAVGYKVSINQEEKKIPQAVFDLNELAEPKDYDVRIKALGDKINHQDSDWSPSISVKRLPSPVLQITKTKLIWNQIEGNHGYELYCDDKYLAHIKKDVTEYDLLNIKAECTFKIQAKGDKLYILDSPFSQKALINKLDIPLNLQYNEEQICWDAVSGADKYKINGDIEPAETNNTSHGLQKIKPGEYNISVQAVSDRDDVFDSDKSHIEAKIEKQQLGRLKGVAIREDRLMWNKLENASGYKITIKQNQTLHKEITESANENFADLLEIGLNDGTYSIEIYAMGNEIYKNSEKETVSYTKTKASIEKPKLNSFENAHITQGVLKWDAIPNATGYVVNIMQGKIRAYNTNIVDGDSLELDVPALCLEPGDYTVVLYALGNAQYKNSATVSFPYTVMMLEIPKNFKCDGKHLTWDSVKNADKYDLVIEGKKAVTVRKNSYEFENELTSGVYNFSLQAVSDNREIQSSRSSILRYDVPNHTLADIKNCKIEYGIFKWNKVENAIGYIISIKGSEGEVLHTFEKTADNEREIDLYALELPLGNYTAAIHALGGGVYDNSKEVTVNYREKMIRDVEVRANFNYSNKYTKIDDYWIQHYVNFSLKQGFTFDNPSASQAEWNNKYTAFLSGSGSTKESAAAAIGNDIIITYYYKDNSGNNVVLLTTGGNPLVKNKLWGSWLWRYNGSEYTQLQGDIAAPFSIGGIVPPSTKLQVSSNIGNKNPAGGNTSITSIQLDEIKGKTLYVDIDVIIKNTTTRFYKETASIKITNY